ncbi:GEP4 (YHR100C) [Zygosaccharomyces parabailii]|uniref:BN860_02916g1_1 n=1 Tax=Zygosaccharomyces bailii (strain CLIB 213 / ATCC 58445 / CBS 680 / BCRC 21525 / NBRC 1098 / NCYC 1416 / NRRL Y-2227) TaxID=1333698 RepID=A0A8J2X4S0_ZYGB2|nr:GEP4 (YHR100C) [Zygosaccharomyces parabailii]CDF87284.1 BN860_02916g1_1 [Zygosaccharomyces bailii CLIB 213]CDH15649.1 probable Phosphatidylglycerophosphatase GEP4,mitochondrial [Zygosaccharomyces bailii ISA1307]
MNISGTFNALRLLYNPRLCMPQLAVSTFNDIPIPISPNIKAVVLDKDNCFAFPHENQVWHAYTEKWAKLKKAYPGAALLVVSNTAGSSDDKEHKQAQSIEKELGVCVLRHDVKKPGCGQEIMDHFQKNKIVESPEQVAIVGDRLFTDIMMANLMGSYGVWITDGVKLSSNPLVKFEKALYSLLKP